MKVARRKPGKWRGLIGLSDEELAQFAAYIIQGRITKNLNYRGDKANYEARYTIWYGEGESKVFMGATSKRQALNHARDAERWERKWLNTRAST